MHVPVLTEHEVLRPRLVNRLQVPQQKLNMQSLLKTKEKGAVLKPVDFHHALTWLHQQRRNRATNRDV